MARLGLLVTSLVILSLSITSVSCTSSSQVSSPSKSSLNVSAVSPNAGVEAGNYTAIVSGTEFQSGATVLFGSTASSSVTFVSSTELQASVPAASSPGAVDVAVANPDGKKAVLHNGFVYKGPAPSISSLSPTSGPASGGTLVTINGSHFSSGASVWFGSSAATSVNVASANQLQAMTPAEASGTVNVTVTNTDGQSATLANAFLYNGSAPAISGISPTSGPTTGGTTVSITGVNFATGALVFFGAVAATGVTVSSPSQIQAVTPAVSSAAAVDVIVQNPDGESGKLAGGFTYTSSSPSTSPTISDVSPNSGTAGTVVDVDGTSFASGATVSFGGNAASNVKFLSSTQLAVTVPTITPGSYDVTVTNPNGPSATLTSGFTVTTPQSLLAGMTPANLKVPSGWTLVTTQDFESGTLPSTQSMGDPNNKSITTTNPHSGAHSEQCNIAWDGAACQLELLPGNIGNFSDVYISYWRYMDPSARGDVEIYFSELRSADNVPSSAHEQMVMDTESYDVDSYALQSMTAVHLSQGVLYATAPGAGNWNLPLGKWEQVEVWEHPNTCTSGVANNDGSYALYINGQRVAGATNININGCGNLMNGHIIAGGVFTYDVWENSSSQCVDRVNRPAGSTFVSCNPGSTCPTVRADGVTPCVNYGPFNVWFDDVIILKK